MKNEEKIEDRIYNNLESYRLNSQNKKFYSMQRIDLIVVSLSTGSIIILLNSIDKIIFFDCILIKLFYFITLFVFALSIFFNIISQWYSHKVHNIESNWANKEMELQNNLIDENLTEDSTDFNKTTYLSNYLSLLFLGLGGIMLFLLLAIIIF